jgi:hypothetical protein
MKRVVSFTSLSFYPRGRSPRYPSYRILNGPQSRSRLRNSNSEPPLVQPVASPYTDCVTEQSTECGITATLKGTFFDINIANASSSVEWMHYCPCSSESSAACNKVITCNHERILFTLNITGPRDIHSRLYKVTANFLSVLKFCCYILPNGTWLRSERCSEFIFKIRVCSVLCSLKLRSQFLFLTWVA